MEHDVSDKMHEVIEIPENHLIIFDGIIFKGNSPYI